MKTLDQWIDKYGVSHKNKTNIIIHKICVPLIMFTVLGILWALPFPIKLHPFLNWATIFFLGSSIFYFLLGIKVFLFMILQSLVMLTGVFYLAKTGSLMKISIIVFIIAWIGQFIGHKIEGQKPSFFNDLQFLFIGPVWVFPFFKK